MQLNFVEMQQVYQALTGMDSYETITPGVKEEPKVVKVPFKLLGNRRILSNNMAVLRNAIKKVVDDRNELFQEFWPDTPHVANNDPQMSKFKVEEVKLYEEKKELELLSLPESVVYGENEFPLDSTSTLEAFGLVKKGE